MSRLRIPVVTALGHRTGASTVALALHGRDAGPWAAAADIVVCRGDGASLRAAEGQLLAPFGLRPVLALTRPGAGPAAPRARVLRLGARFAGVVGLPHVPRWQVPGAALDDAGALLGTPVEQLDPSVAAYAGALRELVAAVLAGGQLAEPVPPVLIGSSAAGPDPPTSAGGAARPGPDDLLAALVAARHPALQLDRSAG